MKMSIVALGQDLYWLTAIKKATARTASAVKIVQCPGELLGCIAKLPKAYENALMLVDASGQTDVEAAVQALRVRGWRYVVVVAADPSAKEAIGILRRNLGYDYWEKTYDEPEIRARVEKCFEEIGADRDA